MFALFRYLPKRELLEQQLPAFVLAFVIAELFYKFRSFALECLAFLATWFVLDLCIDLVLRRVIRRNQAPRPQP